MVPEVPAKIDLVISQPNGPRKGSTGIIEEQPNQTWGAQEQLEELPNGNRW